MPVVSGFQVVEVLHLTQGRRFQSDLLPALGIFTLGFNKESGTAGSYYTVSFNWRERQTDEELQQLELIKAFIEPYRDRLVDLEGTRELVCVDGWSAEQIQAFLVEAKQEAYLRKLDGYNYGYNEQRYDA